MKTILLGITTWLVISSQPMAYGQVVEVEDPNAPVISFEREVIDYGTVTKGGDGMREFRFTNTGKSPLIISNAKGSCQCTVPSYPKHPIKPGESGVIKVQYNTSRTGPINKSVTITSNARTATKVLRIKGQVVDPERPPQVSPIPDNKALN